MDKNKELQEYKQKVAYALGEVTGRLMGKSLSHSGWEKEFHLEMAYKLNKVARGVFPCDEPKKTVPMQLYGKSEPDVIDINVVGQIQTEDLETFAKRDLTNNE